MIDENMPHAISESVVDLGGCKIRCYQLSDGRRILDKNDVDAVLAAVFYGDDEKTIDPPRESQ